MRVLLTFISFLIVSGSFAQTPMTLSEAVEMALSNNMRLKQEQNNLLREEAFKQSARMSLAPTVSANASGGSQTGNSFNQQEGIVVNGTVNFVSGSIGANVDIFSGLRNLYGLKDGQAQVEAQQHRVKRTEQEIISETAFQYLTTLLSQELLQIAQENLNFQEKNLEKIKDEVALGSKARIDEYNQISLLKNAELEVFRAEVKLRNDKSTLALILLIDPAQNFELVEPDIVPTNTPDIESVDYNSALEMRSDLQSTTLTEESSRFQMQIGRANFMPTLSAFSNYGSRYNKINGIQSRSFENQFFTDNRYFNYGLALNIPIFNGMQNRAAYVRDRIAYENAILTRKNKEFEVKSEILRAVLNYRDAVVNHDLATAQLEAAEASYTLNEDSYTLGMISLIEFSQSNRDYFRAKSDLASAKLTLMFQDILLKGAYGTLTLEDVY